MEEPSSDPTARPSQRRRPPPAGIPANPALCKRCNVSLQIDDSFLKQSLETSETGDLYLAGVLSWFPELVFGGIDYVRDDHVATLPGLSRAADSGCKFCAAVKEGLQNKYQGASWWKPQSKPLVLRFQYCWELNIDRTILDSVVVSVKHPELDRRELRERKGDPEPRLRQWEASVLRFVAYSTRDEDPCTKWLNLTRRLSENPWSPQNISMCQTWIDRCVDGTGRCRRGKPQLLGRGAEPNNGSEECSTADNDTDTQSEARATGGAGAGRTQLDQARKHTGGPFLPTRILDLFPIPAQIADCISLVETTNLRMDMRSDESESHIVRYATLSYCWGNDKPTARTTKETLNSHLQCIQLSALPRCLQDAVTVTRGLGIRYLWIDALCIIQDDSDDWAMESGMMYQIFYNSFVTIAAAASQSFNEGFLIPRRVEAIDISFLSTLNPQVVGSFSLSTIPNPDQRNINKSPITFELQYCKWDTRGWVWQEQKLSKRLLVFGQRMIHLKCVHCTRSENKINVEDVYESGPESSRWMRVFDTLPQFGRKQTRERRIQNLFPPMPNIFYPPREAGRELWTTLLNEFTGKQLTFFKDKLPAISGIAKLVDQNSRRKGEGPAQYLAGCWYHPEKHDALHGWQNHLFWRLLSKPSFQDMMKQLRSTDPRTYTAPSWSWASRREASQWVKTSLLDSNVSPPHFEAEIEDYQIVLTGSDPMGRVGPGCCLKLSGFMYPDPLDLSAAIKDSSLEWYIDQTPYLLFSLDWNYSPEDEERYMFESCLRLFALYKWQSSKSGIESRGLLLLPDSGSRHYLRVGAFHTEYHGSNKNLKDKEDFWRWERRWKRQSIYIH